MKSLFKFEPSDFHGGGQMVIRQSSPSGSADVGFAATVSYKIGWIPSGNTVVMVSLADGMVMRFADEAALCEHLNSKGGYRPMTADEIARVTAHVGNRFKEAQ